MPYNFCNFSMLYCSINIWHAHGSKRPDGATTKDEIKNFLKYLSSQKEEWQVNQASEAIQLYEYNKKREYSGHPEGWKAVAKDMRRIIRLKHLSPRTEQAYLHWLRKFYIFLNGKDPSSLESDHVKNFLTYLAVEQKVSVSTQNQAFDAIFFIQAYSR